MRAPSPKLMARIGEAENLRELEQGPREDPPKCCCGHGYYEHHHKGDGGCLGRHFSDGVLCACSKYRPATQPEKGGEG